ncbi:2-dehydropantoate 2-reductase [Corynebacterium cystitidis]|uniref:2-dehydropantoate 2-reductase n=1 Tax=Corynebacterium cystitidis TaxID=35757 RepID=UPI00211DB45D|nr:2-dehydropantoate 2-reductase [Corynebacterium cystitidis]
MRIVFIGVGAVGSWFAGNLARSGGHEHDISVVARGQTLEALRHRGIVLNDEAPIPVHAVEHVSEVTDADIVVLAMKATGGNLDQTLAGISDRALVAVTQNSVEVPHWVAEVVGTHRTLPGVVRGYFHHEGPAKAEFRGGPCSLTIGTWDGRDDERVSAFAAALGTAGIDGIVRDDIFVDVWEKAMFVTCAGVLGAVVDAPLGVLRQRPWRSTLVALMEEVAAAGRAMGVPLSLDVVDRTMDFADSMPAESTTSMQRDIAAGGPGELDSQAGAIVREAGRGGGGAPLHEFAINLILSKLG